MLCVLLALTSCKGDTTADVAWLAEGAPPVAAPDIPWLETGAPVQLPVFYCRDGWTSTLLDNGATICEPWGVGGRETCASPTAMHLPGGPGCEEVGAPCPFGDWPEGLPSTGVVYVAPGGAGDGSSAASPLGSLAAAVAAVDADGTIALAKGTYVGSVTIDRSVTVRGTCAAETILTDTTIGEEEAVVWIEGTAATLRDLQVADAGRLGVRGEGADVTLDGVVLRGNTRQNLRIQEGSLTMRRSLVAEGRERPSNNEAGQGMVQIGGTFDIRDSAVLGNVAGGIMVQEAAGVVDGCVVADTKPQASDNGPGNGITATNSASIELAGVVIEGGTNAGISCRMEATCVLEDVVVRDVQSTPNEGRFGDGLFVAEDASLTGRRVYIDNTGFTGARSVAVVDRPPETVMLDLTDLVITGSYRPPSEEFGGNGILGFGTQTIRLSRAVISDTEAEGVYLTHEMEQAPSGVFADLVVARAHRVGGIGLGVSGSSGAIAIERARFLDNEGAAIDTVGPLDLLDVEVSNGGVPVGARAAGVLVFGGGDVRLRRVVARDVGQFAFSVQESGEVVVEDMLVERVGSGGPADHGTEGFGLGVNLNANDNATVSRVQTSNTTSVGFAGIGTLTVDDLRVTGVVSGPTGQLGLGVFLEPGTEVVGHRWIVDDTRSAGIGLRDATLDVTDLRVGAVSPRSCAADDCADDASAIGVYGDASSRLDVTNFLLTGAATIGAWTDGELSLTNGVIEDTPFGFGAGGGNKVTWDSVDTSAAGAQSPDVAIDPPSMDY
jgi:hypothetical protein